MFLGNKEMHSLLRGAGIAAGSKILAVVCAYGVNLLLARLLGSEGVGLFALAFSVVVSLAFAGRFGLDYVLLRHAALYCARSDMPSLAAWFWRAVLLASVVTGLIWLVASLESGVISIRFFSKPDLDTPLLIMLLALLPQMLIFLQAETLKGCGRIAASQLLQGDGGGVLVYGPALCMALPAAYFWGLEGACWGFACASWFACLYGMRSLKVLFCGVTPGTPPAYGLLARLALPLFFASLLSLIVARGATFMVGMWDSASTVGILVIVQRLSLLGANVQTACSTVLAPRVTALYAEGNVHALAAYVRRMTRVMWLIELAVLGAGMLFAPLILGLLGPDFMHGVTALRVLALGELIGLAFGPVSIMLIATGHSSQHCISVGIAATVHIVCGVTLIPLYGLMGAVVAIVAGGIAQNLTQALFIRRHLKFFPGIVRFGFKA